MTNSLLNDIPISLSCTLYLVLTSKRWHANTLHQDGEHCKPAKHQHVSIMHVL